MIIAIVPQYIEGIGDCCKVKQENGEILHERKLNTVIREIYRTNLVDFSAVKQKSASILRQKCLIPLYVSAIEILIPIKVRQPLFVSDCCYGYVNVFEIKKVFNKEILLKNGERIAFLDTKRAIQKRELMAEILEEKLSRHGEYQFLRSNTTAPIEVFTNHIINLLNQVADERDKRKGSEDQDKLN